MIQHQAMTLGGMCELFMYFYSRQSLSLHVPVIVVLIAQGNFENQPRQDEDNTVTAAAI